MGVAVSSHNCHVHGGGLWPSLKKTHLSNFTACLGLRFSPSQEVFYQEADAVVPVCKYQRIPRDGAPAPLMGFWDGLLGAVPSSGSSCGLVLGQVVQGGNSETFSANILTQW